MCRTECTTASLELDSLRSWPEIFGGRSTQTTMPCSGFHGPMGQFAQSGFQPSLFERFNPDLEDHAAALGSVFSAHQGNRFGASPPRCRNEVHKTFVICGRTVVSGAIEDIQALLHHSG